MVGHAEKVRQAMELRIRGASYDDIARAMDLPDRSSAWKLVKAAVDMARAEAAETAGLHLEVEAERIERLIRAVWPAAVGRPATPTAAAAAPNLFAVDRVVKLLDRKAKLLGLDAPVRHRVEGSLGNAGNSPEDARKQLLDRLARISATIGAGEGR